MLLKIAYYGNPILRQKTEPVLHFNEELITLTKDMIETMHAYNGVGLAAPQIHQAIRLFVMLMPIKTGEDSYSFEEPLVFANPKIQILDKTGWTRSEGCLSIPKLYGEVERPFKIQVNAQNVYGEPFEVALEEMAARVVLHEYDHLNGVLFIDRIHGKARRELDPFLTKLKKNPPQIPPFRKA